MIQKGIKESQLEFGWDSLYRLASTGFRPIQKLNDRNSHSSCGGGADHG